MWYVLLYSNMHVCHVYDCDVLAGKVLDLRNELTISPLPNLEVSRIAVWRVVNNPSS